MVVTTDAFDDGPALYMHPSATLGLKGVVAMKLTSRYRPNERGWIKLKNPNYWRRDDEREAIARKHARRARTRV